MKRNPTRLVAFLGGFALVAAVSWHPVWGDGGHQHDTGDDQKTIERMMEMHKRHAHEHDFEAMEDISGEDMRRVMGLMMDIGLALPPMDSRRGHQLFLNKGCVVCHSVNEVGGVVGPSLNADEMPQPMNAFEFAARMWRGAPAMVQMQEDVLGEVIELSGQDLADLIAFAHDGAEQQKLKQEQIPQQYRGLIIQ